MSRRTKRRIRCPRCSGKKFKSLDKKRQIWQCLKKECSCDFVYVPQSGAYEDIHTPHKSPEARMTQNDNKIVKPEQTVKPEPGSLEEMAEQLGF